MRCANCEREFDETNGDCPYCGAVPEIAGRKNPFAGKENEPPEITVNGDGFYEEGHSRRGGQTSGARARFQTASFSSGILARLLVAAFILFAIFGLLPAFVFVALILAAAWFVLRIFV
jgi:hypothetical protein